MAKQIKEKATAEQVSKVLESAVTFTKSQLLKSEKYVHRTDALTALLKDDQQYSHKEVENILKLFYEGGN